SVRSHAQSCGRCSSRRFSSPVSVAFFGGRFEVASGFSSAGLRPVADSSLALRSAAPLRSPLVLLLSFCCALAFSAARSACWALERSLASRVGLVDSGTAPLGVAFGWLVSGLFSGRAALPLCAAFGVVFAFARSRC